MEMTDQPRWQSGPVEFRVAVCRALLIALAESWAEVEPVAVLPTFGREVGGNQQDYERDSRDGGEDDEGHAAATDEVEGLREGRLVGKSAAVSGCFNFFANRSSAGIRHAGT